MRRRVFQVLSVYSPAARTVLAAGVDQILSVAFTPSDTANYRSATKSVAITARNAPSVALSASTAAPLATVTATIANGLGNALDWVALVAVGGLVELDWMFLNGSRTAPATGVTGVVTLPFTVPATAGAYEVRYHFNNTYTLLATSAPLTVASASLTVSTITPAPGVTVLATIENGPGDATDWSGSMPQGYPVRWI